MLKISKNKLIYITMDIFILTSILVISYYNINWNESLRIDIISSIISIFTVWSIVTVLNIEKDIFTPNMLLILCTVVFIFSPAILYTIGEKDIFLKYKYYVDYKFIYQGMLISLIFFILLHMTMIITSNKINIEVCKNNNSKIFRLVGFSIIAISIIPYINEVSQMMKVISTGLYIDIYSIEKSAISTFITSGIIIYLAGCEDKKNIIISLVFLLIYTVTQLYIGKRGQAFSSIIAYVFLYDRMIKKISRTRIVTLTLIAFVVIIPAISVFRQIEDKSLQDFIYTIHTMENPLKQILKETGFSFMITPYMLSIISIYGYNYGMDYIFALMSSVPGLVYKFDYFIQNGEPASWITKIIDYNEWAKGGGLGFNYIAESYLNFSNIGIIIIPILLVVGIKYISKNNSVEYKIITAMFISYIPMFVRGTSYNLTRPIIWYAVVPIICCYILININRKISNL